MPPLHVDPSGRQAGRSGEWGPCCAVGAIPLCTSLLTEPSQVCGFAVLPVSDQWTEKESEDEREEEKEREEGRGGGRETLY